MELTARNKYFRTTPLDYGLVTLGGFFRFWAVIFLVVTIGIALYKTEDPVAADDPDMDVKKVYKVMWSIVRLKSAASSLIVVLCQADLQTSSPSCSSSSRARSGSSLTTRSPA
jgi:hypothetical protein